MGKTYSRSAAFEDRTGNPLMSLASAAGMEEHAGSSVNGSAPKGLHRAVKVKEEELISDDVKSTQAYNHGKAESLLQACGKASPHSDDSDSDDDPGNLKSQRSGFPKPDFEIFQRAPPPPMFPHSHDDAGEFENILDLGGGDIQASDSEVLNRIQIKKVKQAKATAAFSKAAAATPHRESRDVVARPSSVPISVNSGVPSTGPTKAVHKLTPEERRTRIAKFMDKRTRRRWGRKVEYECRKKLAVQRVRIHGRFA